MSRRSGVIGLAVAALLVANGLVKTVSADRRLQAGQGLRTRDDSAAVPVCKPVKVLPLPGACKPVKALPSPEVCKPVKEYGCVDRAIARRGSTSNP